MKKDTLSEKKLTELLQNEPFFSAVYCYDCVSSTNDLAKELAQGGAPQGTVVLANSQTNGRGRLGRHFYSPGETGLYMSLILRPEDVQQDAGLLTAGAAVAVQQAILAMTGVSVDIKWVNDLYYQNKKLCGILAESQFTSSGSFDYVVLGIGVNLAPPEGGYAEEIQGKTISIAEFYDRGISQAELCAAIFREWFTVYQKLPKAEFLQIYREASCVLGKTISYIQGGETYIGKALSIDERARLIVLLKNGETKTLETGEVTMVRPVL
ncbi:MAG: biotin--[Clostridia bacterium]|nr:biotin--[acetyl-CoA-carboxylase] ligase [Clostridia bacterium]